MGVAFAQTARSDRQRPVIFLIQTRDAMDADLLEILKPVLEAQDIPYLATVEHFDPRDPSGFLGDGHYKPQIDQRFARAFVDLITP